MNISAISPVVSGPPGVAANGGRPRWSRALAPLVATVTVAAGLLVGAVTLPAPAVAAEPALSDVACEGGPVRLLQLRDGTTSDGFSTVSIASVGQPASDSPTFYQWRDITLPVQARAIAAREQREVDGRLVSYAYFTGVDDNLYTLRWDPAAPQPEDRVITRRLTTSGTYGYHRLAYDGSRLWGIKGDDLYFIAIENAWSEPSGASLVKEGFGYPRTFHGVFGGGAEIAYSDSTGALVYLDISGLGTPDRQVTRTTVAASGWGNSGNVWLGAGLVYRVSGVDNNLLRRQTVNPTSTGYTVSSYQTVATGIVAPDARITAAPDTCRTEPAPVTTSSPMVSIAESYAGRDGGAACDDANMVGDGECKAFVNCVAKLAGQAPPVSGYYQAYLRAGYVRVTKSQARAGDIVQTYAAEDPDTFRSGYHTSILTEPFGSDNAAVFVDSNYVAHHQVGIHLWDPYARADAYDLQVGIWRWPGA